MDTIPEIIFVTGNMRSDVVNPKADWELLLRLVADFAIKIRGDVFYAEKEFPVVEFCAQAARWLKLPDKDFEYRSMESEVDPLLKFSLDRDGGIIPTSHFQELRIGKVIDEASFSHSLRTLIDDVVENVRYEFGLNISRLVR